MLAIWKKDLFGYFKTPIGYAFIGVFLTLAGFIFYVYNLQNATGDLLGFLSQLTQLLMFLAPLLTMKLLSEERQKRTDQLLFTSPHTLTQIVLAKYFACATVWLFTLLCSQAYTFIIVLYGKIFIKEWFVGYLGFALQGLSFLALDLWVSSFAKNQITGAVAGFGANFLLWMIDMLATTIGGVVGKFLLGFSLYNRYLPFTLGQLSVGSLVFYLCFIIVCLVLTIHVLDVRRFRNGGRL